MEDNTETTKNHTEPQKSPLLTAQPYFKSKHIPKPRRQKYTSITQLYHPTDSIKSTTKRPGQLNSTIKNPATTNIIKSIKMNYIFYIALFICSYIYSNRNVYITIALVSTFFLSGTIGYFVHMFSHNFSYHRLYNTTPNILKEHKISDYITRKIIWFFDYHHIIHHDSEINKRPLYIILEFINNLFMEGGGILILLFLSKYLQLESIFIWMFMYATGHNINYILKPCSQHINHHKDDHTNYGFDWYDILFGSKYDMNNLENYNHLTINIVIGFLLLYIGKKLIQKYKHYNIFNI